MQQLSFSSIHGTVTPFPLINAVVAGLQEGTIFRDENCEELCFIIHKAAFSYVSGVPGKYYQHALSFLLNSLEIPGYFHVYHPPLDFLALCEKKSSEVNTRIRKRIQLQFSGEKPLRRHDVLPAGYSVRQINENDFDLTAVFNLSINSKFWKSKADFIANGFGFCVFNAANSPVSICYSACVANGVAEIDVLTMPEYQRRGLAGIAVASFVAYCLQKGVIANWDCFEENTGSLRTAESIGFNQTMSYTFLSIFNKNKS